MKTWLWQIIVALDQLANSIVPGGWADETLSSRAHRMRQKRQRYWGWTANAIDRLFFWQHNHCAQAYADEADRLQLPPELRGTPAEPTPYYPPGTDPTDQ